MRSPSMRLHQDPACGGGTRMGETKLHIGVSRHIPLRLAHPDHTRPMKVGRSWMWFSRVLHDRPLDDDARRHVLPQRH